MKPDTIVQSVDDHIFWALWKVFADNTTISLGHILSPDPGFYWINHLFLISRNIKTSIVIQLFSIAPYKCCPTCSCKKIKDVSASCNMLKHACKTVLFSFQKSLLHTVYAVYSSFNSRGHQNANIMVVHSIKNKLFHTKQMYKNLFSTHLIVGRIQE